MAPIETPLDRAIRYAGSARQLAKGVDVAKGTIDYAKTHGVSAKLAIAIETYTDGFVRKEELAPDLFPPPRAPRPKSKPRKRGPGKSISIFPED